MTDIQRSDTRPSPMQSSPMPAPPTPPQGALSATDARQGMMTGRMRWVLGISVTLAIVAMVLAYWVR